LDSNFIMPTWFVGHGSPMNAIADNDFTRALSRQAALLPAKPKAILCISAHWETHGTRVTTSPAPRTIHDFRGFPPELFAVEYPAPGSPELAERVRLMFDEGQVQGDARWGLDHGSWSLLRHMYPAADVPVVQLSLDRGLNPEQHYALARGLRPLREEGVLILGSGNIVHSLPLIQWSEDAPPYDWAVEFDAAIRDFLLARNHVGLMRYRELLGRSAELSVPTEEHYLPLLYAAGVHRDDEPLSFFYEGMQNASISMRSLQFG
jgi:4,5-DOPA dioxygenase extradiol